MCQTRLPRRGLESPQPAQEFALARVRGEPMHFHNLGSDAFEGKVYANYIWRSDKRKKYWEVTPFDCKVMLLSGEERLCHSSDEFDALVKQYME